MGWEGFMGMERRQLRERRAGKLRRALGLPLPGESVEQLDRIGEQDRRRAKHAQETRPGPVLSPWSGGLRAELATANFGE
jgi:hypothetical protein